MRLTEIGAAVDETLGVQLDELYQTYCARDPLGSVDGFLLDLLHKGLVTEEVVASLHARSAVATINDTTFPEDTEPWTTEAPHPSLARYDVIGTLAAGAMGEILVAKELALQRKNRGKADPSPHCE